jgi:hypothetical protein
MSKKASDLTSLTATGHLTGGGDGAILQRNTRLTCEKRTYRVVYFEQASVFIA